MINGVKSIASNSKRCGGGNILLIFGELYMHNGEHYTQAFGVIVSGEPLEYWNGEEFRFRHKNFIGAFDEPLTMKQVDEIIRNRPVKPYDGYGYHPNQLV